MREAGLLYLEQIEDFKNDCDRGHEVCDAALERWDRVFESFEDRITINLSGDHLPGDSSYFELLKSTKHAANMFLLLNETRALYAKTGKNIDGEDYWEEWLKIFTGCQYDAHQFSLRGFYRDYGEDSCVRRAQSLHHEISKPEFTGEEAKARSWHTQAYCEKDGYMWGNDGVCHAKK